MKLQERPYDFRWVKIGLEYKKLSIVIKRSKHFMSAGTKKVLFSDESLSEGSA